MSQESHLTIEVCYAKSIVYDQDQSSTPFQIKLKIDEKQHETNHVMGNEPKWDHLFSFNFEQVSRKEIELRLCTGNSILGQKTLSFKRLKQDYSDHRKNKCVILEINDKKTAELYVSVDFQKKKDLVGGVKAPRVNLNPNCQFFDSEEENEIVEVIQTIKRQKTVKNAQEKGFERSRAAKLNLFSCMDADDIETEFFPSKFKTKITKPDQQQALI